MLVNAKQAIIAVIVHPSISFIELQTVAPQPFCCGFSNTLLKECEIPLVDILCAV